MTIINDIHTIKNLIESGQIESALHIIRQAMDNGETNPNFPYLMGHCYMKQGQFTLAYQSFKSAIEASPKNTASANLEHFQYCLNIAKLKAFGVGADLDFLLQSALKNTHDPYQLIGYCLALVRANQEKSPADEQSLHHALVLLDKMLQQQNDSEVRASAHNITGMIHQQLADYQRASDYYRQAINHQEIKADAHHNLGHVLSIMGQFPEAWHHLEYRWQTEQFKTQKSHLPGQPLHPHIHPSQYLGKSLLIGAEQGLGDEILYSLLLPKIYDMGFAHIAMQADKRLHPILQRTHPKITLYPRGAVNWPECDFHCYAGSLPYILNLFADKQPVRHILQDETTRTHHYRQQILQLANGRIPVAIAWKSFAPFYQRRNIALDDLHILLNDPQYIFFNAQYGECSAEIDNFNQNNRGQILQIAQIDCQNDIDKLASMLCACAYLVSADISTAHLGGALGVKTAILLPNRPNMRWSSFATGRSDWFESVRLIAMGTGGWPASAQTARQLLQNWR